MKNRVLRSALAVILVIAMVLTMAACNNTDPVETTAPVVTSAPAATTTPTEAPVVTVAPTEAPAVEVVDGDEAQLAEYGITFPEFDLSYVSSDDYEDDDMAFGLDVDTDNIYQEAYLFSISAKISAVKLDGSSLSKSKYDASSLDYDIDHYDAGEAEDWDGEDSEYYFQVGVTGVYTVTYTIEVEHDKDDEYGYYAPGEVDEKYEITKTYTVEKGELELKTSDDAFEVEDSIFFADATVDNQPTFEGLVDGDYSISVDVTSCDGTVVGEYALSITITDDDSNVVDPSDIVLDNYYVTVTEGTRYILSAEDIAKANAMRKMYYDNFGSMGGKTTEYAQETIAYYESLTAGQKVMAAADSDYSKEGDDLYAEAKRLAAYLVVNDPVDSDAIEEVEYNMNRDYIIDEVEDAIEAYMTASTQAKKDAALTALADLILSIDNTANEYGSDLSYVLTSLATGVYIDASMATSVTEATLAGETIYWAYYAANVEGTTTTYTSLYEGDIVDLTDYSKGIVKVMSYDSDMSPIADFLPGAITGYDVTNTDAIYVISTTDYDNNENIVAFQNEEDDDEYDVTFGYQVDESLGDDICVVNAEYDGYLKDWIEDYEYALYYYNIVVYDQEIEQADIDNLTKYVGNMEGEYADLITYQLSYKPDYDEYVSSARIAGFDGTDKVSSLNSDMIEAAEKIVSRWDAYIALIEAYGFESSYIDNANADEMTATFAAMNALLGYDLKNATLSSEVVDGTGISYSYVEFTTSVTMQQNNLEVPAGKYLVYDYDHDEYDSDTQAANRLKESGDVSSCDYYFIYEGIWCRFIDNSSFIYSNGVKTEAKATVEEATLSDTTLSNVLFATTMDGEVQYATPDLFVDDVLAATEDMMQVAIAVQSEVDAVKQDLVNYVVSTGYYTSHINGAANLAYAAALDTAAKLYGNDGSDVTTFQYIYQADTDGVITAALAMPSNSYTTSADLLSAYNSAFGTAYTGTWTLGTSTISTSIDTAGSLDDIQAWIDYQVLAQALYEDSDFWKDLEKKGLDTAMSEMFEDIIEEAWDRVDAMDEAIEAAKEKTADATYATSAATITTTYTNGVVAYATATAVDADGATVAISDTGVLTTGTLTAGTYYYYVTAKIAYTGADLYLGTVDTVITVKVVVDAD
ncbi:MAG: hypothetical protein R3Y65_01020 [Bacillota bacterium]